MAEETEDKEQTFEKKEKSAKSGWDRFFKVLAVILLVFGLIILIIAGTRNPELGIGKIILYGILLFGLSGLLFFIFTLVDFSRGKKEKEKQALEEKLPKPATIQELKKLRKQIMDDSEYLVYEKINHNGEPTVLDQGLTPVGDKGMLIYRYIFYDAFSKKKMAILINSHYPKDRYRILTNNPPDQTIKKVEMQLAGAKDESEIIERIDEDLHRGVISRVKSKKPASRKKKKVKKEEDLG